MKIIKRLLKYILLLITVSGCSSFSEMQLEVLRPAGYSLPPEIKSVVLIDNSDVFPDTMVNIIELDGGVVKIDTTKTRDYTSVVLKTVQEELNRRLFFDTVFIDTLQYKIISGRGPIEELSPGQIKNICSNFGADAIVSLDAYRYRNKVSVTEIGDYEYYAAFDASAINYWRMYRCSDNKIMDVFFQKDTIFWDNVGESVNNSLHTFPSFLEATHEIGEYLAYKFADHLAPYWEEVNRRIYVSGNMNFINAIDWVNKGNWEEAEKLWNYIYVNGSKKAQLRAAVNLALAMERKGNIDEAVVWASKAYEHSMQATTLSEKTRIYVMKLYRELAKRKQEYKKLKEQLGDI